MKANDLPDREDVGAQEIIRVEKKSICKSDYDNIDGDDYYLMNISNKLYHNN